MYDRQSARHSGTGAYKFKFADTGIQLLYESMIKNGAAASRITAKIAGGANMFATTTPAMSIGDRNVEATKKALAKLGVPIIASDTGLNYGRTVSFNASDGSLEIMSSLKGNKTI